MKEYNKPKYLNIMRSALCREDYWRLFIDGEKQKKGHIEAETGFFMWMHREVSGLNHMLQAAKFLFDKEQIDKEVTLPFIIEIHKLAFPAKDHLLFDMYGLTEKHHMVNCSRVFHIGHKASTREIEILKSRAKNIKKEFKSESEPWKVEDDGRIVALWSADVIDKYVPAILKKYNTEIKGAVTPQQKLSCILQIIKDLDNAHIFTDGNIRVLYLILNKELISNGLSPVILNDPNDFDYKTIRDLSKEIKKGEETFLRFSQGKLPYDDCVPNEVIWQNIIIAQSPESFWNERDVNRMIIQKYLENNVSNWKFVNEELIEKNADGSLKFNSLTIAYDAKALNYIEQIVQLNMQSNSIAKDLKFIIGDLQRVGIIYFKQWCVHNGIDYKKIQPSEVNNFLMSFQSDVILLAYSYEMNINQFHTNIKSLLNFIKQLKELKFQDWCIKNKIDPQNITQSKIDDLLEQFKTRFKSLEDWKSKSDSKKITQSSDTLLASLKAKDYQDWCIKNKIDPQNITQSQIDDLLKEYESIDFEMQGSGSQSFKNWCMEKEIDFDQTIKRLHFDIMNPEVKLDIASDKDGVNNSCKVDAGICNIKRDEDDDRGTDSSKYSCGKLNDVKFGSTSSAGFSGATASSSKTTGDNNTSTSAKNIAVLFHSPVMLNTIENQKLMAQVQYFMNYGEVYETLADAIENNAVIIFGQQEQDVRMYNVTSIVNQPQMGMQGLTTIEEDLYSSEQITSCNIIEDTSGHLQYI